jgi:hypothetical protein
VRLRPNDLMDMDLMDMHRNRWLAGRRGPPKCRLSLGATGSPRAARQARRRPRELAPGSKGPAPNRPGPVDLAALQTLATRLHEAVDNAKRPGWGPTALHALSSFVHRSGKAGMIVISARHLMHFGRTLHFRSSGSTGAGGPPMRAVSRPILTQHKKLRRRLPLK